MDSTLFANFSIFAKFQCFLPISMLLAKCQYFLPISILFAKVVYTDWFLQEYMQGHFSRTLCMAIVFEYTDTKSYPLNA